MGNQNNNAEIVKNVTMSVTKANIYGLLICIPIYIIFGLMFIGLWGSDTLKVGWNSFLSDKIEFLTILLLGIVVHEGLHGLSWAFFCKNGLKSIKFGIKWSYLTPYAHCKEPLTVNQYRIGAAMPGFILGVIPYLVSLVLGNAWLMCFGLIFTTLAAGDILVLWNLKNFDENYLMLDHPNEIGFMVLKKKEDEIDV